MTTPINEQLALARLIREFLLSLPKMARTGWPKRGIPLTLQETIAEHSFGVAGLAFFLAVMAQEKGIKVDPFKAAVLGLFHDHQEAETGDLPRPLNLILAELGVSKTDVERRAQEHLAQNLPRLLKKYLLDLFEEFLKGESIEAQIAIDADNLQAGTKALDYSVQRYRTFDIVHATQGDLKTLQASEIWRSLLGIQQSDSAPPQPPAP